MTEGAVPRASADPASACLYEMTSRPRPPPSRRRDSQTRPRPVHVLHPSRRREQNPCVQASSLRLDVMYPLRPREERARFRRAATPCHSVVYLRNTTRKLSRIAFDYGNRHERLSSKPGPSDTSGTALLLGGAGFHLAYSARWGCRIGACKSHCPCAHGCSRKSRRLLSS